MLQKKPGTIKWLGVIAVLLACACTNPEKENQTALQVSPPTSTPADTGKIEDVQPIPEAADIREVNYEAMDSLIRDNIRQLDKTYASTPFYTRINGNILYMICTGKSTYGVETFGGVLQYGLADDSLEVVLEPVFDKIYNPNLTVSDCMEVKKGNKAGLFNFSTRALLEPQFDYIMPASAKPGTIAYGIKSREWYEIRSDSMFTVIPAPSFSPTTLLGKLSFDVHQLNGNLMYDSYSNTDETRDAVIGKGVVVLPSYIEHMKILHRDYFGDVITSDQEYYDFGTSAMTMKADKELTFYEKIKAFVVSVYEEGVDARGYAMNSENLVVYNPENHNLKTVSLTGGGDSDFLCSGQSYRLANDSIIEVKSRSSSDRYRYETSYKYYKVTKEGDVIELGSSRHYDFTKFVVINESYFSGCFAYPIEEREQAGPMGANMYMLEHLTMEDLDIMRNEIFAEYGYVFKTEKWKNYFAGRFTPQYDNVDDQLTEVDKANIKTILKVRKAMENKEDEYTKKRTYAYYPPG